MNTPEDYIFDALEAVSAWDLPDEESFINAANQQAKLMAGCLDDYEDAEMELHSTSINNH